MQKAADALVAERTEELRALGSRRAEHLRELFLITRRGSSRPTFFEKEEEDDEALRVFLRRFDIEKNSDGANIRGLEWEDMQEWLKPEPEPEEDVPQAASSPRRPAPAATKSPSTPEPTIIPANSAMEVDEPSAAAGAAHYVDAAEALREPAPLDNSISTSTLSGGLATSTSDVFAASVPSGTTQPVAGPSRLFASSPTRVQHPPVPPHNAATSNPSSTQPPARAVSPAITSLPPSALMLPPANPVALATALTPAAVPPQLNFPKSTAEAPDASAPPPRAPVTFTLAREYTLPPLKSLPLEHQRRSKLAKAAKKRERAGDAAPLVGADGRREDWAPLGLNRWGATLRANPLWTRVARAQKTLSTREWGVALAELRLIRAFERIDALKLEGKWSFRQPKKQRGIGGQSKTHWDYLLDEMAWMRTDFREERRWKIALAFDLSTAVLEWWKAGTRERRLEEGIVVDWTKPQPVMDERRAPSAGPAEMDEDEPVEEPPAPTHVPAPKGSTSALSQLVDADYASDDSDEEQETERQEVVDALTPGQQLDDAFAMSQQTDGDAEPSPALLKAEDVEPSSNAQTPMDVDAAQPSAAQPSGESGLKAGSRDPNFATATWEATEAKKPKKGGADALRAELAHSDALVYDMQDLFSALPEYKDAALPPGDALDAFPDWPLYDFDVAPAAPAAEGKKKGDKRDDPTRRADPTTATRLAPVSLFQQQRPTLLGPLEPATHWADGDWFGLDDGPVYVDFDAPPRAVDAGVGLFDGPRPEVDDDKLLPSAPRDPAKRVPDANWTAADDDLLRALAERYPRNWALIADAFNSARLAVAAERRADWECKERFVLRFRARPEAPPADGPPTPVSATPRPAVTTRKRLASQSTRDAPSVPGASGAESHKRKRHGYVNDAIRKATKRRESTLKQHANARRGTTMHESHNELKKTAKLNPAELSRLKHDKDARANHEAQMAARRVQGQHQQAQMMQGRIPVPQMQMPTQNGGTPPNGAMPVAQRVAQAQVPQMRAQHPQVNISQAQRVPSANGPQMTPQQMQYVQQMQAQAAVHAQRGAAVAAASAGMPGALPPSASHLSPQYAGAGARGGSPNVVGQQSPPRGAGTPNPPGRPGSAAMLQASPNMQQALARPPGGMNGFMQVQSNAMQNMQHYTAEQLNALRAAQAQSVAMMQAQQQAQQQQQQQQQQGASGSSGAY